jgi:multidrug resistance efflux pump
LWALSLFRAIGAWRVGLSKHAVCEPQPWFIGLIFFMKNSFDVRKRNLGSEPTNENTNWLRRLIISAVVLVVIVSSVIGGVVWYSMTHVTTVYAAIHGDVVKLAPDVDARMQGLFVRPGQKVEAGQALARLDDSHLRAALASAKAEMAIRRSQVAQATAQAKMVEAQTLTDIELAQAQVEMAKRRSEGARRRLALRKKKVPEEIRRAKAYRAETKARLDYLRKGARKEQIAMAEARLATAKAREELLTYQVEQTDKLVKWGVEAKLKLEQVKTELRAKENESREAELLVKQLKAGPTDDQIEAVKQALEARDAAVTLAESAAEEIPLLAAELAIRQAALRECNASLRRAEARSAEVEVAAEKIKAAQAELERSKAGVAQHKAQLERMTLVSPVAGTVIRTFDSVGEVVRKGVPTIIVSDDSEGRWVEGFVHEDEAADLKVGQTARVELVLGSGDYVEARVEAVGLATSAIARTEADPANGRYLAGLVWVKLRSEKSIDTLLPGMSARATIRIHSMASAPAPTMKAELPH